MQVCGIFVTAKLAHTSAFSEIKTNLGCLVLDHQRGNYNLAEKFSMGFPLNAREHHLQTVVKGRKIGTNCCGKFQIYFGIL
jgi:hypothetical protein